MTEVCVHPKGAIVVPEPAVPAFRNAILPKPELAITVPPKTLKGKFKNGLKKSGLITAPVLTLGCLGQVAVAPQFLDFNFLNVMLVMGLGVVGTSTGIVGSIHAIDSLIKGDRSWTPLPPTKKFLELEVAKQKPVIQPFKDWDDVFDRANRKA